MFYLLKVNSVTSLPQKPAYIPPTQPLIGTAQPMISTSQPILGSAQSLINTQPLGMTNQQLVGATQPLIPGGQPLVTQQPLMGGGMPLVPGLGGMAPPTGVVQPVNMMGVAVSNASSMIPTGWCICVPTVVKINKPLFFFNRYSTTNAYDTPSSTFSQWGSALGKCNSNCAADSVSTARWIWRRSAAFGTEYVINW